MMSFLPPAALRRVLCVLTVLLLAAAPSRAQRGPTTIYRGAKASANTVIVQVREPVAQLDAGAQRAGADLAAARSALGARVTARIARRGLEEWRVSTDIETALARLNALPGVKAYPNLMLKPPAPPEQAALGTTGRRAVTGGAVSRATGASVRASGGGAAQPVPSLADLQQLARPRPVEAARPLDVAALGGAAATTTTGDTLWSDALDNPTGVEAAWTTADYGSGDVWELVPGGSGAAGRAFLAGDTSAAGSYADGSNTYAWPAAFDLTGLSPDSAYVLRFQFAAEVAGAGDAFSVALFDRGYDVLDAFTFPSADGAWNVAEIDLTPYLGMDFLEVDFVFASDASGSEGFGAFFDEVALVRVPLSDEAYPNDPLYDRLWGLHNDGTFRDGYSVPGVDIGAEEAWEVTKGSDEVAVVVFDTGIDYTHPDLQANMWVNPGEDLNGDGVLQPEEINGVDDDGNGYADDIYGWDPATDTWDIMDQHGHGTHVAGTIGAVGDNATGVIGVSPNVRLIGVDILDGTTMDILEAYEYVSTLLADGVPIVASNQSWGFNFPGLNQFDPSVLELVDLIRAYAQEHSRYGMVWVCSAGNDAFDNDVLPGFRVPASVQAPNVISVGAMDSADYPGSFTSFGRYTVDIGAPGVRIISTTPTGYGSQSGTSMASPHVTGALALTSTVYPEESVLDRVARVMATGVFVERYEALWRTGARLDVSNMIDPARGGAGVLLAGSTGLIFKAYGEEEGVSTVGFVNATAADISVTGAAIAGEDAASFSVSEADLRAEPVAPGGAFGLPVTFVPADGGAQQVYAATLTLTTAAGSDIVIELSGLDQPVAVADLDPATERAGQVPMGTTLEATTTLTNEGDLPLEFTVGQGLVVDDGGLTAVLEARRAGLDVPQPAREPGAAPARPTRARLEQMTRQVEARAPQRASRTLSLSNRVPARDAAPFADPNLEAIYFENFDDPARVDSTWAVVDNGDLEFGEPSGAVWELEALGEPDGGYAMVAGDLDGLLAPATWTVAMPPAFDFTGLPADRQPYYLSFDYAAELDGIEQRFYVYAYAGGDYQGILAHTDTRLATDGEGHSILIDISAFAGMTDVQFYFVALYEDIEPTGFGALFDDVAILTGDAEYFASRYEGLVEPGASEELTVTVRTGLLPEGQYSLFTDLTTLAVNAFAIEHELIFTVIDADLLADPQVALIEEPLTRGGELVSPFTVHNEGDEEVGFATASALTQMDGRAFGLEPAAERAVETATARARAAHGRAASETAALPKVSLLEEPAAVRAVQPERAPGRVASQVLADHAALEVLFYEGFEDSLTVPSYWTVTDRSPGSGSLWHVEDIGTPEQPQHVAGVGELAAEAPRYANNSATSLISPPVAVGELGEGEALFVEFAYHVAIELGYDVLQVELLGFGADGALVEGGQRTLAASEPGYGLQPYASGVSLSAVDLPEDVAFVQVAFTFTSDGGVNEGFAFVDDVMVSSGPAPTSVEPANGVIAAGASQAFDLLIDAALLRPASYRATAQVIYTLGGETGAVLHDVFFEVVNRAPTARADTLGVTEGTAVPLALLGEVLVGNDTDPDGDSLWVAEYTEPLHGEIRAPYFDEPPFYVAPVGEADDVMQYVATDGVDRSSPATVVIEVHAEPRFVSSLQQEYAVQEDQALSLSTLRLASGLWGAGEDVRLWAETSSDELAATIDTAAHTLTFQPQPDASGSFEATLYVGAPGQPTDSANVTVVVAPVNDAPEASFTSTVDGAMVTFENTSADIDDERLSAEWTFGDGTASTALSPTHTYAEAGTYEVTLTVTDASGATATATKTIEVPTGSGVAAEEVPGALVLQQNYPNPFNPSTTIRFGLPEAQVVTLRVYNALGQVVHTLYEGAALAPGYHSVTLDASELASGLYLYQLEAVGPGGSRTRLPAKKMVLVK